MAQNGSLTPRQRKAIPAMLTASTIGEAAKIANIGERTLNRWLAKNDTFKGALQEAQNDAINAAISRLSGESAAAANTLAIIHKDESISPAVRVQAAQAVLKMVLQLREQKELADRVTELEEKVTVKVIKGIDPSLL